MLTHRRECVGKEGKIGYQGIGLTDRIILPHWKEINAAACQKRAYVSEILRHCVV